MSTFDRKPRPASTHPPAQEAGSQRPGSAPQRRPPRLGLAAPGGAGAMASPGTTDEGRRYFEPISPAPRCAPRSNTDRAASEADGRTGSPTPVDRADEVAEDATRGEAEPSRTAPSLAQRLRAYIRVVDEKGTSERGAAVQASVDRVVSPSAPPEVGAPPGTTDSRVHEVARRGTRGAGGPLPFLDVIQRSFGRHDVSRIQSHADAAASASARAMGASAFTTGDDVAFAGEPTLHTAAHEAAHWVQQRAGIQLVGGVGAAGDRHERHADAVADLVVRGQSAEALLGEPSKGSGSSSPRGRSVPSVGESSRGNVDVGGLVQRQSSRRQEMIAALRAELDAAATDPGRYEQVAVLINGFNREDIKRQTARLTVEQLRGTRAAVERHLDGWPEQQTILDAIDAYAAAKRALLRPLGSSVWAKYSRVHYDIIPGEAKRRVWEIVGGSVGKGFDGQNTCAARLSYAFNYGGYPIRERDQGWIYPNDPKTVHNGRAGDGMGYIVSASYMETHLRKKWGPPDASLKTNPDAKAFESTLLVDQVAVFAGTHHVGVIKPGYSDPYVFLDPGVMPVFAWKLP